jgi:two-component system, response regulator PdtaR
MAALSRKQAEIPIDSAPFRNRSSQTAAPPDSPERARVERSAASEGFSMLKILIVEDDDLFARTLKHMVELNPRYQVTGVAVDCAAALASVAALRPDLALVDLQLANNSTGFATAAKLREEGVPSLFTTGRAPSFPVPDLALGCLHKPFTEEDLVRSLKAAEDLLRGREPLRPSRPPNLHIYADEEELGPDRAPLARAVRPRTAPTVRRRLQKWWTRTLDAA